jgi:hypothetical protein
MSIELQKIFIGTLLACIALGIVGFSVDFLTEITIVRYLYVAAILVFICLNVLAIIGMCKNSRATFGFKLLCMPGFVIASLVFI